MGGRVPRTGARLPLAVMAAAAVAGCAVMDQPLRSDLVSGTSDVQRCAGWFVTLDEVIDRAAVHDAEAYRIPGFPYLRVNRFLASFREQAIRDSGAFAAWEQRLAELDARARGYELSNLPSPSLAALGVATRSEAAAVTSHCAAIIATLDATTASRRDALAERAQVPDDYADWKRALGLYPLVKLPFFEFAKGWQNEATGMFQLAALGPAENRPFARYQPPDGSLSAPQVATLLAQTKQDALGVPLFSERDRAALVATFAPVFEIETSGDYDRIGPLRWGSDEVPEVDVSRPTVYQRIAFTRYGGRTLVQVVYSIWFPERPKTGWLDPVSGTLDGIVFRVTLDPSGHPLVYDSIHACGCYHMFFPTPFATPIAPPDPNVEWAFIPRHLTAIEAPQRIVVRITSGNHYLTDVRPDAGGRGAVYAVADDGQLRTLPVAGGTRSAFGPDGIVAGTDRGERLVTWPLGIESAGAMREWGRHATALVGRRQFDDADLIERRFAIAAPTAVHAAAPRGAE
jgi:hypothetical protein